jgi:hypothetical protein
MIRPGSNVNRPAITSAPAKVKIITRRCPLTSWRCARHTPSGNTTKVKIDSKWIGLQGPNERIWWIQNELTATIAINAAQIQPSVRWGNVPFGATNWITPSPKAAIAAKACSGIWGAASSSGARLTADVLFAFLNFTLWIAAESVEFRTLIDHTYLAQPFYQRSNLYKHFE